MYNKEILRKLKSRAVLRKVISSYLPLYKTYENSKRGKVTGYYGCCPFHNEQTPSLHLYKFRHASSKGTWGCKCFGCGWSGDVFAFVMMKECVSFNEAYREVNKRWSQRGQRQYDPKQLRIPFTENMLVNRKLTTYIGRIFKNRKEYLKHVPKSPHFRFDLFTGVSDENTDLPF